MDITYYKYLKDVKSNKIIVCDYIHKAIDHFYEMKKKYIFDEKKVENVINFISLIKHYKGKFAGKSFLLEPWQQFLIASIYGFYQIEYQSILDDEGNSKIIKIRSRVVKEVYLEMSRKQGKSSFGSALCCYHLIADHEPSAEVYIAANSLDQANVSFKMTYEFAQTLDPSAKYLKRNRREIDIARTKSWLKVLSSDDTKLDGLNASMYLLDEFHAARNNRLKSVLDSSQAMRENPMKFIITTAGYDKNGPCYKYRKMCIEILQGVKKDDSIFSAIYALDPSDDWKNSKMWIKCAPNLGVTVQSKFMKDAVITAKNDPSQEVNIKTKTFNMWCDSKTTWISSDLINTASRKVSTLKFRDKTIYLGIDLAAVKDFTSVSALLVDEIKDRYYFKSWVFVPEDTLEISERFKILYGGWAKMGHIHLTPGNVTDYDIILNLVMRLSRIAYIDEIAYDSWNATQFAINAETNGLKMKPYSQTIGNFNIPTKELERLITAGKVIIDDNAVTRFCFSNVNLKHDWNDNVKPDKSNPEKKIDVTISMIEALGAYLRRSNVSCEVY